MNNITITLLIINGIALVFYIVILPNLIKDSLNEKDNIIQYEYRRITVDSMHFMYRDETINLIGNDGWELIQVIVIDDTITHYYFKRKKI
jgi:hypothetical protein